jgi:ribose 5-phosphate isomerase A
MSDLERSKRTAGKKSVDFIKPGMVVGLGTGSTAKYMIEELGKRIKTGRLTNIRCVASSKQTEIQAQQLGLPLTAFRNINQIDITIDGADEIDKNLNLIKGGGGALLREKILAQNSRRLMIIADETKMSGFLGEKWSVPIEVLPFAWEIEAAYLQSIGGEWSIRKAKSAEIFLTDQQNYILDCNFGVMQDPGLIANKLDQRAGILGHGLFINMASDVIIGADDSWRHISVQS